MHRNHPHRPPAATFLFAAAALALSSVPSLAATFCVSPNSTPSLAQRLLDWHADSANTTTVIRLEQGTYPISIAVDFRDGSTGDLDLEGGYVPGFGCSDNHRSKDAAGTVLDGGGNGQGTFAIAFETNLRLAVLTLQGYQSPTGYDGVFLGAIDSPGNVSVDHVVSFANSAFTVRGGTGAIVKDVLVYGQPIGVPFDAMSLSTESGTATGTNLTVTQNKSGGLRLGDRSDIVLPGVVYNAIVYANSGEDVYPDSGASQQGEVHDSIVGVLDAQVVRVNVQNVDPRFVDANADFHLDTTPTHLSPAINAGNSSPPNGLPGTDIEGNSRVQGGAPDLGAYEMNTPFYATYVVTNNQDNGSDSAPVVNSLRWAIMHARGDALLGSGRKLHVAFNLPCPSLIVLNSAAPLHDIDFDLTLDGSTNPGWSANSGIAAGFDATLCAGINGNAALADGLHVVSGGRLTVEGLRFGGFTDAAIRIDGGSGDLIFGNQIGGAGVGPLNLSDTNKDGVRISGNATGVFVGAYDAPATRNQISDNTGVGVHIDTSGGSAASANYVVGNLIGLGSDGRSAFANGDGVYVFNSGFAQIANNTISGNTNSGVTLSGGATKFTLLENNLIGLPESGNGMPGNGSYGVLVSLAAFDNTIGAGQMQSGGGNSIYSSGTGVYVSPSGGPGNRILANKIASGTGLGIDLGPAGPTPNDTHDTDTGPNALQNFPVLTGAYRSTQLQVDGVLDSVPNDAYRLDFYWCSSAGSGGRGAATLWLGHASSGVTDANGHVQFAVQVPSPAFYIPTIAAGFISATATDSSGNTSELGPVRMEIADVIFRDEFE